MLIPREHWHRHIGYPVVVHTTHGHYCGQLHGITNSHVIVNGHRLASTAADKGLQATTLAQEADPAIELAYYYNPAALAIPIVGIVGITALGLAAMGLW